MGTLKRIIGEHRLMAVELVAFDFDGTLTDAEMVVRLAQARGVGEQVAAISERAMAGEVDYATSLRERVALLDGLSTERMEGVFNEIELRGDAVRAIENLRARSIRVAILTGGFERGVSRALASAGIAVDHLVANALVVEDDRLTGEVEGPLIEGTKDAALERVVDADGLALENAVAIGDGANDIPMLRRAAFAVGFRPKPVVRPHCDVCITTLDDLTAVLDLDPR